MRKLSISSLFSQEDIRSSSGPLSVSTLFKRDKVKKTDFSIENLIKVRKNKESKVKKEYRKKLEQCKEEIEKTNNLHKYDMIYTVPMAIYDCPEYNPYDCLQYIESDIKKYFMYTLILPSKNKIFITWDNIEEEKKKDEEKKDQEKRAARQNEEAEMKNQGDMASLLY